jgi:hypothetical protein
VFPFVAAVVSWTVAPAHTAVSGRVLTVGFGNTLTVTESFAAQPIEFFASK